MGFTAIFGGTFNPIHCGHYEMLKSLQNDQSIDEIWIMPDRIPPHKECDILASDTDRIEMCQAVAEDFSKATVCLIEFEREGRSYTFDTITILKQEYPDKDFVFVCGGDMFIYLPNWYRYSDLIKLLPFYVFSRVSTDNQEFEKALESIQKDGLKIILNNAEIPNISSTDFRTTGNGKLLPEKIYKYICKRGIYNV